MSMLTVIAMAAVWTIRGSTAVGLWVLQMHCLCVLTAFLCS